MLSWQRHLSGGIMQHHLNVIPISTGQNYSDLENLQLRAFLHFLLDALPEEGLEEVRDSLLEAIDFYSESKAISECYQPDESFEIAIGEGYERPVFQIAED